MRSTLTSSLSFTVTLNLVAQAPTFFIFTFSPNAVIISWASSERLFVVTALFTTGSVES